MGTAIDSFLPPYKTICFIPEHLDYYLKNLSKYRNRVLANNEITYIYQGVYRTLLKVKGLPDIVNTLIFLIENILNIRISSVEADILVSLIKYMEYDIRECMGYEFYAIKVERSLVCITVKTS